MLKKMAKDDAEEVECGDELEEYLAVPEETDLNLKTLQWWASREGRWPSLCKMAKQYLAAPASTGGVERKLSAAGKMHDDLKKSAKDDTLEAALFACFNTD
uniref:HAT C-terminal dimerisation domain-containing protein n=1 Tax=Coccolithus braarudii TaxID=221442 RepID=A0A7S0LP94_9EUKA|mmetsp:Transcript_48239/g.103020  ORF Transcript_48239/g.103020 Transcript_48239/m.103020 type:complete len:101 (+) Transcript_48239:236-538(+)